MCLEYDLKPRADVIPSYSPYATKGVEDRRETTPRQVFGQERQKQGMKGDQGMSGSLPPGIVGNEKVPCYFLG